MGLCISDWFLSHDVIEVFSWDFPSITGSSLKHFFKLIGVHSFSKFFSYSSDVVEIDCSSSVIIKQVENSIDSSLNKFIITLVYLSPNFEVIASKNYSKSISRPSDYKSAIMLKIVGFFDSKPKLCMADLSSLHIISITLGQFCQWPQCQTNWRLLSVPQFHQLWAQVFRWSFWLVL